MTSLGSILASSGLANTITAVGATLLLAAHAAVSYFRK